MPRVVPSQVVAFMASLPDHITSTGSASLNIIGPAAISTILSLTEQVRDELLAMDQPTYVHFELAKERLREALATWSANKHANSQLEPRQFHKTGDPVQTIRDALSQCPDQSPPA